MENGRITVNGEETMTLKEAAHLLHRNNRQIVGLGQTVPFNAPPWHAHFAEVEVDTRTGQVTVLRVVAAHAVVDNSIRQLLNPDLTASWEKGLTYVAEGTITPDEYMQKLERFVAGRTVNVIRMDNHYHMRQFFDRAADYYNPKAGKSRTGTSKQE